VAVTESSIGQPARCCAPLFGRTISDDEAHATASLLRALADCTRVQIVNLLSNSPEAVCVCDINAHFDLSQPTISHHLKKLVSDKSSMRMEDSDERP
jgi:ArsR family transcriptional regulator, arsenate/arsenite/antimonite-responsive transcriptional repressor